MTGAGRVECSRLRRIGPMFGMAQLALPSKRRRRRPGRCRRRWYSLHLPVSCSAPEGLAYNCTLRMKLKSYSRDPHSRHPSAHALAASRRRPCRRAAPRVCCRPQAHFHLFCSPLPVSPLAQLRCLAPQNRQQLQHFGNCRQREQHIQPPPNRRNGERLWLAFCRAAISALLCSPV